MSISGVPCATCKHFDRARSRRGHAVCAAFPNGIPSEVTMGMHRHREPIPGDQGIQWELSDEFQMLRKPEPEAEPAAA